MGRKVKAHQDEKKSYGNLDPWEKVNIKANKLAKEHLQTILTTALPPYKPTKSKGWNIQLKEKVITQQVEKNIILHCTEEGTKKYWAQQLSISEETIDTINWITFQETRKYLSSYQQLFIVKHTVGISATG